MNATKPSSDRNLNFKDQHVLVTGGTKGIGRSAVEAFHARGAKVSFIGREQRDGEAIMAELGERVKFYACDVADPDRVAATCEAAQKHFGPVQHLINNAGIVRYGSVVSMELEDWELTMNVNLRSMFLFAKHCIPQMESYETGTVINVASVQSFISQVNVAAYSASKSAALGLTRSIAVDHAPKIRCLCVCPGTIDTPMLADAAALAPDPDAVYQECRDMHILKRIGQPEEVAEMIVFLCSKHAAFMTGQSIRIDGGLGCNIGGSPEK